MTVMLSSTYFNPQILLNWLSVTQSSCFPAISSILFLILSPSFHLSGCLFCTGIHQSSLANHTGFSGYFSMVSIPGKICTGRILLWRDFPAIVILHFEDLAHRFKLTFFSLNCLKFPLPIIWLSPVLTPHSVTSLKVPVTSTQPNDAFLLVRIWLSKSVTQITSSTRWRLNFQMGKTWNRQTLCF